MNRIIELEDHGQDFTRFVIDENNIITAAQPFQGWLWKGFKISTRKIRPGMRLTLRKPGSPGSVMLKYPVASVRDEPS